MEERIDDINKAWEMAHAGKRFRDAARAQDRIIPEKEKQRLDRIAIEKEDSEGDNFEYEKRKAERKAQSSHETLKNSEKGEIFPEGFKIEELTSAGRNLCFAFKRREGDVLSPLIEPVEISKLAATLDRLDSGVQSKRIDEVTTALDSIIRILNNIGHADQPRGLREDDASLGRIISVLDSLQDVSRSTTSENDIIKTKLKRISSTAEEKRLFVAKRRQLLREYQN